MEQYFLDKALEKYLYSLSPKCNKIDASNGFVSGFMVAIYGQPLSGRLTAEEADMIRKEYTNTYPLDPDCGVANILIQGVLERIFGKDFFKEDKI